MRPSIFEDREDGQADSSRCRKCNRDRYAFDVTNLRLVNLRKEFDQTVAVEDVSIDIPTGSLFFLLGSSGCGKTTILRMVAGFVKPTRGTILFGSRDVSKLPPEKRNAGMVFQNYALWPHMSVAQNVGFGLDVRKMSTSDKKQRIGESLDLVRMSEYANRLPNQLSGGQQQRVALARAIAFRPDLLLLDEPLSNLDAKLRLEMRAEIRRISNELKITMLYVTHDQHEALSLADQIAVMRGGRIEQLGTPRDVYDRPRTRFVAEFIGETNFVHGKVVGARGADGTVSVETPIGTLRAIVPESKTDGSDVTLSIRPESLRVIETHDAVNTASTSLLMLGQCVESTYLGSTAQHAVVVQGHRIKVFEANPRHQSFAGKDIRLGVMHKQVVAVCE
ncbi:MAG: ABC transporter ATP-binding protein [Phycisphaerales bacterium]|nr:ABC transporter ATP-binding protein [Phycisphaerales bacterium]